MSQVVLGEGFEVEAQFQSWLPLILMPGFGASGPSYYNSAALPRYREDSRVLNLYTSIMALSQQERTLRLITIGSWVPGMALLIPYGVKSQMAFPPLGLIPLTMSAIVGLAKVYSSAGYIQYTVFMDALIAILLLCFIIPGFPMRWPELGTFAVCPLFVNMYAPPCHIRRLHVV